MADRNQHPLARIALVAVAVAALFAGGCGPKQAASCWPAACPSDSPAAPAPIIDAAPPAQPANPIKHSASVRIFVEDPIGNDAGPYVETHTVTYQQPPDGVILSNGVPAPYTKTNRTPVQLDLTWDEGIPGVQVLVVAEGIPSGYSLACQILNANGQPIGYPPPTTAPLDPHGFYRLKLVCPVSV